eukprot:Rmarinus@m.28473
MLRTTPAPNPTLTIPACACAKMAGRATSVIHPAVIRMSVSLAMCRTHALLASTIPKLATPASTSRIAQRPSLAPAAATAVVTKLMFVLATRLTTERTLGTNARSSTALPLTSAAATVCATSPTCATVKTMTWAIPCTRVTIAACGSARRMMKGMSAATGAFARRHSHARATSVSPGAIAALMFAMT